MLARPHPLGRVEPNRKGPIQLAPRYWKRWASGEPTGPIVHEPLAGAFAGSESRAIAGPNPAASAKPILAGIAVLLKIFLRTHSVSRDYNKIVTILLIAGLGLLVVVGAFLLLTHAKK